MSRIHIEPRAAPSLSARVLSRLAEGWARYRRRREHRRAMVYLLTHADDVMLKDVGLTRSLLVGEYLDPDRSLR